MDFCIKNNIDFFNINQPYIESVKSDKTDPGADVPSDNRLLLGEVTLGLKTIKCIEVPYRLNADYLGNTRQMTVNSMENKFEIKNHQYNIQDDWQKQKSKHKRLNTMFSACIGK